MKASPLEIVERLMEEYPSRDVTLRESVTVDDGIETPGIN